LKARSQSFRDDLWGGILKGDRAEIASSGGDFFFWQKNYIGFVKLMQVCSVGVEIGSEREETGIDQVPKMLKEGRAKAIRSRTGVGIHGEKGQLDFRGGEGADNGLSLEGV